MFSKAKYIMKNKEKQIENCKKLELFIKSAILLWRDEKDVLYVFFESDSWEKGKKIKLASDLKHIFRIF